MKIEHYTFGRMIIAGEEYRKDLIIRPSGIFANWWRKSGHQVCAEDLEPLEQEKIDTLIIGTGKFGLVRILDSAQDFIESHGWKLVAARTDKAVKIYNESDPKTTAGAFHLTC